jgi:hypothetical protein
MGMRRALATGFVGLLALVLLAPVAQGATQQRQVRVEIPSSPTAPPTPPGTLTLRFVFKNKAGTPSRFTPRQLVRIDFSNVALRCANNPGEPTSQLLFTRTLNVAVKLMKVPPPSGKKPKPGRYAFRFAYSFTDFNGTLRSTIDKPNRKKGPRPTRSQGSLTINDLDAGPGQTNCSTTGPKSWGGVPVTGV